MSNVVSLVELQQMGVAIAASNLYGIKKPEEFIALALVAQAEGRHPAIVARDYHIISGKPTLKADAILARFQDCGGKVDWKKYANDACEAVFSHPSGGSVLISWSIEDAKKAGLTGNQTWSKYPRAMLRARCISEGVRTVFPAVLCGIYTEEEVRESNESPIVMNGKPLIGTDSEVFPKALEAIATGKTTVEQALVKYDFTPEAFDILKGVQNEAV